MIIDLKKDRERIEALYRRESEVYRDNALITLQRATGFGSDCVDFDLSSEARINAHIKNLTDSLKSLGAASKVAKIRRLRTYSNRLSDVSEMLKHISIEFDIACEKIFTEARHESYKKANR